MGVQTGFVSLGLLLACVPTFFIISITPGLCMTLALTMGMTIGVRRTLWMMVGELCGVALMATVSALSLSELMVAFPALFVVLRYAAGAYLIYVGLRSWLAVRGVHRDDAPLHGVRMQPPQLCLQGFLAAVSNPKGWIFFLSLLPPFIVPTASVGLQVMVLVSLIVLIEFVCLMIYATGGRALKVVLQTGRSIAMVDRLAGSVMVLLGVYLVVVG